MSNSDCLLPCAEIEKPFVSAGVDVESYNAGGINKSLVCTEYTMPLYAIYLDYRFALFKGRGRYANAIKNYAELMYLAESVERYFFKWGRE